ncbi:MAG TPA: hypothetical protein VH370_03175 [Humisphaera sp.]|nr:hypothetical protein [Humisphaera sp.]
MLASIHPRYIALLLTLSVAPLTARAADNPEDVKKVKETAKSFVAAIMKGDSVEAHRYATSDEITNTMIESIIPVIKAAAKLREATAANFGAQGQAFANQMNPANFMKQWTKIADEADVIFDGRYAVFTPKMPPPPDNQQGAQNDPNQNDPNQQGQGQPQGRRGGFFGNRGNQDPKQPRRPIDNGLRLRFEAERWRVDLSALPMAQQLMQMAPMLSSVAEAMGQTAEEIKAGNFETVQDVQQALQQRIMQAVMRRQFGGQ